MTKSDQASRPVTVTYPPLSGRPGSPRRRRPALRDTYVNQHFRMVLPDGQPVDLVVSDDPGQLDRPRVGAPLAPRHLPGDLPTDEWYFVAAWDPTEPPIHNGWGAPAARIKSLVEGAGLPFATAIACEPDGSWLEINAVIRDVDEDQARQVARQVGVPYFCRLAGQRWDVLATRQPGAEPVSAHTRFFSADEPTCPSHIGAEPSQPCLDPGGIAGPAIHASAFFQARRKLGIALLRCKTCANGAGREAEGNFLFDGVRLPTRTRGWEPVDPTYRTNPRATTAGPVRQLVGIRLESFLTDVSAVRTKGTSR
ncbi:MAG: hypothetical protein ACOYD0_12025 [Candidatus Nanopelagicales bacterium]